MILEQPTRKQYEYAQKISEELEVEMPIEYSKRSYSDYISYYVSEYKRSLNTYHLEEEEEVS